MRQIIGKLAVLEKSSRKLEPPKAQRDLLLNEALHYADEFLDHMEDRPVYTTEVEARNFNLFIQETPTPAMDIIKFIKQEVDHPGLNPASGRHIAYIPGGGLFAGAVGDYLAAVFNKYAGLYFASPGAVRLENSLIRWMCEMIGYPDSALGNLTSGGSVANLIGIVTARDAMKITSEKVKKSVVYVSPQIHHSVQKAVRIAGLGECTIRMIELDKHFRINPVHLANAIAADKAAGFVPFLVVASVGTTDTGAIDPIPDIADICSKEHLWLHIDAAYGGFFILSEEGKKIIDGMHLADSIVLDPHKGLFLPYGSGAVLVKNGKHLFDSHYYTADYMQDSKRMNDEISPADLSPELTKHFRGLRLLMPLLHFGLKPFRDALDEKIWLARYFYEKLKLVDGFELGPPPQLSVVIYRYLPRNADPDAFNLKLIARIQNNGEVFLSSTRIHGTVYLRLAVLNFRTHKHHIDLCIEELIAHAKCLDAV